MIVGDMRHVVGLPERPSEAVCYRRVEYMDDYKVSKSSVDKRDRLSTYRIKFFFKFSKLSLYIIKVILNEIDVEILKLSFAK